MTVPRQAVPVNRLAWSLFAAVSVLWGIPYFFIKLAVDELSPPVVVVARTAIAAAVLLPVAVAQGALPAMRRHAGTIAALGLVHVVGPFLLITYGETHISSSLTGLLIATEPIVIAVLALRFDRGERLTGIRAAGLGLGFLGVAALVGFDLSGDRLGLLGAGMVLLATVGYAAATLLVRRRASDVPPLGVVTGAMVVATVVLAPFAALTWPHRGPGPKAWSALLVLGVLCTALAFLAFYKLVAVAGSGRASLVTYVNPAVAMLLGVAFLNESLRPATILGFVLILAGCWLCTRQAGAPRSADNGPSATAAGSGQGAGPEPLALPSSVDGR